MQLNKSNHSTKRKTADKLLFIGFFAHFSTVSTALLVELKRYYLDIYIVFLCNKFMFEISLHHINIERPAGGWCFSKFQNKQNGSNSEFTKQ